MLVSLGDALAQRPVLKRYMDLTKFLSILETESLFFPVADILPDLAEGMQHDQTELTMMKVLDSIVEKNGGDITWSAAKKAETANQIQSFRKKFICVSSWYASQHESYAMWKLYAAEGVCVNTTEQNLLTALKRGDVYLRNVEYDKKPDLEPSYLAPFFKKLPAYRYESEVRVVVNLFEKYGHDQKTWEEPEFKDLLRNSGIFVPVNVGMMISSVIVSPLAKPWFRTLVPSVLKRYGLDTKVVISELAGQVLY